MKFLLFQIKYDIGCIWRKWRKKLSGIFYIGGSDVFPPPLKTEEEAILLEQLGGEDDVKVKSVLIERNLRLVVYIARKFENTGVNVEDLISIGSIGLIKAIKTFKLDKNIRLATYASRCIENEILMSLRASKKYNQDVSLQDPIGTDRDGNEIVILDIISAENDNIAEQIDLKMQTKQLYKNLKSVLKDREKLVIELRYGLYGGEEVTQQEIAKMLGISRSYVSRIEKKALKKLYAEMKQ